MQTAEARGCKVEKCKREYRAKGFCHVHYKKWRQGEFGKQRYKTCHSEGCLKPVHKSGVCEAHFGVKAPKAEEAAPAAETKKEEAATEVKAEATPEA